MKYLIYITGSISCYKSIDLCRSLVNEGHEVIVVLSEAAEKFIKKELFNYLGVKATYSHTDDFSNDGNEIKHIELSRWCDQFVICPASANTISHLANGITKDLGTTIFLALKPEIPKIIFPAMNTHMLENKIIKNNFKNLQSVSNTFLLPTENGVLACGEVGNGKLLNIEKIFSILNTWPIKIIDKKVLISTGASIAPLDDVRYLTNPSSGKTGLKLAETFLKNGYDVELISGVYSKKIFQNLIDHPHFKLHIAKTAHDYLSITKTVIKSADIFISAAAICDISFKYDSGKIKKSNLSNSLEISTSPDVLKEMMSEKKQTQYFVGFAAEANLSLNILKQKWESKKVDLLIGTEVNSGAERGTSTRGFQTDEANYKIFENQEISFAGTISKTQLSQIIFTKAHEWLN